MCPNVLAENAFNEDVLSSNLVNLEFCADCAASLDWVYAFILSIEPLIEREYAFKDAVDSCNLSNLKPYAFIVVVLLCVYEFNEVIPLLAVNEFNDAVLSSILVNLTFADEV